MNTLKPKIIVIVGPTASGKSSLAVETAKEFGGEVISADSRQVYRGLDIATGKITEKEKGGIPHHLLDVADPNDRFTVIDFKERAEEAITETLENNNLPIIEGGSGFYIQAIVDNFTPPDVPANEKLRERLQKKSTEELFDMLKELDERRAEEIDENNPRRLIRAIEIARELGEVPRKKDTDPKYDSLQIGLRLPKDELKERIKKRTGDRLERGMIEEARALHENGLSYERMEALGLEYRYLTEYLKGNLKKDELREKIETGDWQYAKKQMSWFKRDERIEWFHPNDQDKVLERIAQFIDKMK